MGKIVGAGFGDVQNPLLVSVRSGSRASMPGMMDTVLNLGLNDQTVEGLAARSGDRRFAYDTYRRFIQMYADVVLGLDHELFEEILENYKGLKGLEYDTEPRRRGLERRSSPASRPWSRASSASPSRRIFTPSSGAPSPPCSAPGRMRAPSPIAACTIFPTSWGTAVNVQAMVFGNMGENRATGVAFTRNPSTGANELYGEFLVNAQGEDVVAGIRTPQPLTEAARRAAEREAPSLEEAHARRLRELKAACAKLEAHFRDMQDIEFTVQDGKLFMLQTRSGKRTTQAALKIAVDMAEEGLITKERGGDAHRRRPARPAAASDARSQRRARPCIAKGLPASPGAASGELVFDADEAEQLKAQGRNGDPGARRDLARGHPRHACRARHPHRARRHDQPRGGGGARHGPALRRRRRRVSIDLEARDAATRRRALLKGRHHHHRRLDRADHQGPRGDARAGAVGGLRHA